MIKNISIIKALEKKVANEIRTEEDENFFKFMNILAAEDMAKLLKIEIDIRTMSDEEIQLFINDNEERYNKLQKFQ